MHPWKAFSKPPRGKLRIGVTVVGVLDLVIVFLGTFPKTAKWFTLAWSIGSLGVVTFLGIFMLENFVGTDTKPGTVVGVRDSITATFMIVYFAVLGLALSGSSDIASSDIAKSLIGNFTYLAGIVVIFYFGSKTVSDVLASKKTGDEGVRPSTRAVPEDPKGDAP